MKRQSLSMLSLEGSEIMSRDLKIMEHTSAFAAFVDKILRRGLRTPDFEDLNKDNKLHKVFVYGTLMNNLGNNHILKDSVFLGDCSTVNNNYEMIDFGLFPGLVKVKRGEGFFIMGELYEVSLEELMVCDRLESNGFFYKRELCKVMEHNKSTTHAAWIYVLVKDQPLLPPVEEWEGSQSWWLCSGSWG